METTVRPPLYWRPMKKTLLLVLATLWLSACVSLPKGQWPSPNRPLVNYAVLGKVAIITPNKRDSANLYWQQQKQTFNLKLTSFLGTSVLSMEGEPGKVSLTNSEGTFKDTDAQYLLYQLTGWQLPVNDFPQWLKGQSGERGMIVKKDSKGRIDTLQSEGWTIQYLRWTQAGGRDLPAMLDMSKDNIKIKLQINEWQPR